MRPLAGQSVLITGAAHGIGAEVARRLSARGARVSLVGLGGDALQAVAADCPGAVSFHADVTDAAALDAAVEGTLEAFGGIDVVFANAGIGGPGFVRSLEPEFFDRIVEVDLLGVWRTVRACLPHVMERQGYVLCVASMTAIAPPPGLAPYAAAKAGVEAFSHSLRAEMRPFGVKVGVAYFSWIDTELVRGADRTDLGARMRGALKGPLARTYPVADAAGAVVAGIEHRRRNVVWPRWLLALMAVRPLIPLVTEVGMARDMAELDALAEREVRERGSYAVGAGGTADRERR